MSTAVVCAAFDPVADDAVEALRRQVEAAGHRARRSHRPHLTLAAARVAEVEAVVAVAAAVAVRHAPIPLQIQELGAFRDSVLWVAPAASDPLRSLQRDVHDSLVAARWRSAFGAQSEPGRWVAHCTLATRLPRSATRRLLREQFTPFPATIEALVVIVVGGHGDIAHLPLSLSGDITP